MFTLLLLGVWVVGFGYDGVYFGLGLSLRGGLPLFFSDLYGLGLTVIGLLQLWVLCLWIY